MAVTRSAIGTASASRSCAGISCTPDDSLQSLTYADRVGHRIVVKSLRYLLSENTECLSTPSLASAAS
jgi:hypothetical protein